MEAKFAEVLRIYSGKRAQLLKSLLGKIPPGYIENKYTVHGVLLAVVVLIIITIFMTTRRLSLFSLHPVCMVIGCILFFGEGIVSYKNNFMVESLGPIMQHNKTSKLRAIHQSSQFIGAGFMLLGLLFILANKFDYKKTIIPRTPHSIVGTICIMAVAVQAFIGQSKIDRLLETHRRIYRWHGDMGLVLWDLVCITTVLGLASILSVSFFSLLALLLPLIACTAVHLQLQLSGYLRDDDTRSNSIDEGDSLIIEEGGSGETPPKADKLYLDTEAIKAENSEEEGDSFSDDSNHP